MANFKSIFGFFLIISSISTNVLGEERIVSLKPNITDILVDLGYENHIVGVTKYCNYPKLLNKIDFIADYVHVDVERVMVLSPTLVIGSEENSVKKEILFLRNRGIKVNLYPFKTLGDTYQSIGKISKLLSVEKRGDEIIEKIKVSLDRLKPDLKNEREKRSVLIVVGTRPFVVVGGNNLLDDLLQIAGLNNIARSSILSYPTYSSEKLISSQPDIIIDLSMGSEERGDGKSLKWYRQFSSIPAVKNNRVYFLDMKDFLASPKLVGGVKKLVKIIHTQ